MGSNGWEGLPSPGSSHPPRSQSGGARHPRSPSERRCVEESSRAVGTAMSGLSRARVWACAACSEEDGTHSSRSQDTEHSGPGLRRRRRRRSRAAAARAPSTLCRRRCAKESNPPARAGKTRRREYRAPKRCMESANVDMALGPPSYRRGRRGWRAPVTFCSVDLYVTKLARTSCARI